MNTSVLLSIQNDIRKLTGFDFTLVGGCVRDTMYGAEPKDYDAVICMGDSYAFEDVFLEDVFLEMEYISENLSRAGFKSKVYRAYGINLGESVPQDSFQNMFLGCIKVNLYGYDVDLLFSKYESIEEHVSHHDCNMNMCWLREDGTIEWQVHDTLEFNGVINPARVERMTNKFHWLRHNFKDK